MASGRTSNKDTVIISKYNYEFDNFYDDQVALCDRLSGSKIIYFNYKDKQDEKEVGINNFKVGLRHLKAFIINYIHYVPEYLVKTNIRDRMADLDKEFENDSEYNDLVKKQNKTVDDKVTLNKKYLTYLTKSYELITDFCQALQSTLMVNTSSIKKKLSFSTTDKFFTNISQYRKGVSDFVANYELTNCLEVYKKVLGYHYTYRLFLDPEEIHKINNVMSNLNEVIFSEEFLPLFMKLKSKNLSSSDRVNLKIADAYILRAVSKIYELTNEGLSYKNVLPELKRKMILDRTGI